MAATAVAAAALALVSVADAQQVDQQPQFRGAVDRVLVDVTVVDEDGRFVPGLTLADFEIREEGRPVELNFFALERFRNNLDHDPSANGGDDTLAAPEIDDVLASAPVLPRYMVLFIDGFNTAPWEWEQVRYTINQYLDTRLQENDRLLLATLTPDRRLLVGPEFTRDVEALKRTLNQLAANPGIRQRERDNQEQLLRVLYEDSNSLATVNSAFVDSQLPLDVEANMLRQGANLANVFAGQRKDEILFTIDSMTALATHLSRTFAVPGPKTMVMVSSGIAQNPGSAYYYILDSRADQASIQARSESPGANEHPVAYRSRFATTIEAYLMRAIGHLNRLNYTLYTIGAAGNGAASMADAMTTVRTNLTPGTNAIAFRDRQEGLRMLSDGTGGLAFDNSANFAEAFNRIDRDTAFRYVLGYAPPERDPRASDDKFYRIRVEVNRDDVQVRARRGYVDG